MLRFAVPQSRSEIFETDLQRLRAQPRHARGKLLGVLDAAELPAIVVKQNAAIERQNRVRVFAGRAAQQQLAGHAEMDHQIGAAIERRQNEFAVAFDAGNLASGQAGGHAVRVAAAQDAQTGEFGRDNAAALQRRDGAHHGFDFGQFRHQAPSLRKIGEDVFAFHFHCISGDAHGGVEIVFTRAAIELPKMIGTHHAAVADLALPQRAAGMRTDAPQRGNVSARVADGVRFTAHRNFDYGVRRQFRQGGNFLKRQCCLPWGRAHGLPGYARAQAMGPRYRCSAIASRLIPVPRVRRPMPV